MKFKKALNDRGKNMDATPNEDKVAETVRKSIEAFYSVERERRLTYGEFLRTQFHLIRKRWWIFQALLLVLSWFVLSSTRADQSIKRILGVSAPLFVILVIPELWKNRTSKSMEIENASLYSLKRIYAARILMFGVVDTALITVFCIIVAYETNILFSDLLAQFLFPMTVTAAICFGVLCDRSPFRETTAVMLCIVWSAVWLTVILNEKIYAAVKFPLWLIFMGSALVFLAIMIRGSIKGCDNYLEAKENGIDVK